MADYPNDKNVPDAKQMMHDMAQRAIAGMKDTMAANIALPHVVAMGLAQENTWAAHAMLIKNPAAGLGFDPKKFAYFDGKIAQILANPALTDATHPHYGMFAGLRTNIAVIRNVLLNHAFAHNQLEGAQQAQMERMQSIAEAIGESLKGVKSINPFAQAFNADVAGIEGLGAAKLYQHLLRQQEKPGKLQALLQKPQREWNLPAIEDTAFSMAGLAAPPPGFKMQDKVKKDTSGNDEDLLSRAREAKPAQATIKQPVTDDPIIIASIAAVEAVKRFSSVADMAEPAKDESVEEARKILRGLRNMEFTDRNLEEFLDHGTPKVVASKKKSLQKLLQIITVQVQELHRRRKRNGEEGEDEDDMAISNAQDAAQAIALTIAEHTFNGLPDGHPMLDELEALIDAMPESALMRQSHPLARLLDTLEFGLEHATGQEVSDLSPANRLLVISDRIQANAYKLHTPDPAEKPSREESLDLARDIFSKLKKLSYANQPIEDFINTAKPETKAAFAQQIDEMVENYRQLMLELTQHNPDIAHDQAIQNANDAIGQAAQSVKLMAAKEIPSNEAATQQISADIARMPEKWGDLHSRTIDRLIKGAEEGVEKALGEMQEEQEEQSIETVVTESSLHDAAHRRKKKRRGESKSRSGKGGAKQRKVQADISADDYVLKQGRFAEDATLARKDFQVPLQAQGADLPPPQLPTIPGIKAEDMDAIKKLGGSLRDIGKQLKGLVPGIASVSAGDKIAPDDKSAAQRVIENELQKGPRNQGPGVS